ncbi:MAG TPA: hypothetical protein DEH78_26125, partial [Solibacterales bacterium]|nr:hypothetical protein [Bryobacterales bacterium]
VGGAVAAILGGRKGGEQGATGVVGKPEIDGHRGEGREFLSTPHMEAAAGGGDQCEGSAVSMSGGGGDAVEADFDGFHRTFEAFDPDGRQTGLGIGAEDGGACLLAALCGEGSRAEGHGEGDEDPGLGGAREAASRVHDEPSKDQP